MPQVLIVDDDASYSAFLQRYLDAMGLKAERAASGQEALALCRSRTPDLIILDWCLGPGLSGYDTLKALRAYPETKRIPVVAISGVRNSPEDERAAIRTGAHIFLSKMEIPDQTRDGGVLLRHLHALLPAQKPAPPPPVLEDGEGGAAAVEKRCGSILIADDDPDFAGYLNTVLSAQGHRVKSASSGRAAVEAISSFSPDLVILDIELGDASGLEICRRLKGQPKTAMIPVMIVTGHAIKPYWAASLRFGADLFMPKTAPPDQFSSCVDALLARVHDQRAGDGAVSIGTFSINPAVHSMIIDGRLVETLTAKLFDLAYLLVSQRGRVLERAEIMRRLKMTDVRDNEINVLMHVLRRRLGPRGKDLFKTVRGMGYCFDEAGCR